MSTNLSLDYQSSGADDADNFVSTKAAALSEVIQEALMAKGRAAVTSVSAFQDQITASAAGEDAMEQARLKHPAQVAMAVLEKPRS